MVERSLQDRQNAVGARAATAHGFLAAVESAVLLRLAWLGPRTRKRFNEPSLPFAQQVRRQRCYLDIAERWVDMRLGAVTRVNRALAVSFKKLEIAFDSSLHGQRAGHTIGGVRATDHMNASLVLRLRKTENDYPVGVGKVVCDAEPLDDVALATHVVPRNPCPCDARSSFAAFEPAIADVQPRLEQPVVRLATAGETASTLSGLKLCVRGSARHRSCPTDVQ